MDWFRVQDAERRPPPEALGVALSGPSALADVRDFLKARGLDQPTPLRPLPALAAELGLGQLMVKDESARMGLNSFKALGGAYAVASLVRSAASERLGREVTHHELSRPEIRAATPGLVFACATDGNHGRAVALGARLVGAKAVVFVHQGVASSRRTRLARDGAQVVEVPGVYDDALGAVREACETNGWRLVSDCAFEGYEAIPECIMRGYGVLVDEALDEMAQAPTHVFVQGGVGGLAAAMASGLVRRFGANRPRLAIVEPARAACLLASAQAGRPVRIAEGEPTAMALLECYEPSLTAWRVLAGAADVYVAVDEAAAFEATTRLEQPRRGDPVLASSPSGAAGLAGLMTALKNPALRDAAALGPGSCVLLVNSERAIEG